MPSARSQPCCQPGDGAWMGPGSIRGSIQRSGAPAGRCRGKNSARFLSVRNKGVKPGRFGAMGSAGGTFLLLGQRRCPRSRYPGARREKAVIKPLTRGFAGVAGGNSKGGLQRAFMAPCPPNPRRGIFCASPTALAMSEHPLPGADHLRSLKQSIPRWKLHRERAASPSRRH